MHRADDVTSDFAIAPTVTTIPVAGTDAVFPVARVYCIGRNYAEHAIEMGHDPDREPPFFFMKPADAVVPTGSTLAFPRQTEDLHHEIELVVALGEGGRDIAVDDALEHVYGYAVGLDMTRRDIQAVAKKAGRPWDMAKGFDESAPCSPIRTVKDVGHPDAGNIWLKINDETRQQGDLDQQIWKVPEAIAYLSSLVTLRAGDLIMTGTPAGVGRVEPGDRLEGHIDDVGDLSVSYEGRRTTGRSSCGRP
jgi:fumarylpyruvate hydrolase